KVLITFGAVAVVAVLVLNRYDWNLDSLLSAAAQNSGHPDAYLRPGLELGRNATGRLDFIGLQMTVVLGAAVMPHMIMRINAVAALAAAPALAPDVHAHAVRRGRLTEAAEVRTVRWSVVAVGTLGIVLATMSQGYNVQFLSSLSIAVGASAVLPALVYSLFWS